MIQKMLRDYYEIIEYDLKPRPVVMENIEKVINCGDPSYGGAMYICTHCKIGNLSLSVATVVFVLPVAINMPWNALPVCLLNS